MKYSFTKTVLLASVCVTAHGANPALCATNDTAACVTVQEEREIEEAIAKAPEMMLPQTNSVWEYASMVCEKIKKCPAPETRYRYFRKLMESACQVDFAKIRDSVPEEEVEMPPWWSGVWLTRKDKIADRLTDTYRRLRELVYVIWKNLALSRTPAPFVEQFEPYFKLIEKLRFEEKRLEMRLPLMKTVPKYADTVADLIEFRIRSSCLHHLRDLCESPDPQDLGRFAESFRQVVGRPIRIEEQFNIDSRRRMENIIKKREGK